MTRKNGSSNGLAHDLSRLRRAFLATKRDELMAPARVIADITTRLVQESESLDESLGFHGDMEKNYAAGRNLVGLIEKILSSGGVDQAGSSLSMEELQHALRHEMLNELNTVIMCSEMWIEDARDHFLDGFLPDLKLIKNAAYRCVRLIDEIINSWDINDTLELSTDEVELFRCLVKEDPESPSCAPGRILVADDIKTNRDFLQRNLERMGHIVKIARTGGEVLTIIEREEFDLVLLDIKMPEMNGIEVLTAIKSDPAYRDLPVIMISALSDIEVVARCIKLGAEDYLPKPFNSVLLSARIEACLQKRRLALAIESAQQKTHQLLEVILPPLIIKELREEDRVTPRRYENVAVLFADIVGFTAYCEGNPPETVMNRLGLLVESWEETAVKYGVEKIKTIGDAFMAATGLWNSTENPVADCIRCGMEMIAATKELAAPWNLRVGIHIGPVVAGVMGKRKYLFDLWGDTVNTAARMESHGIPGAISLSSEAWSRVKHLGTGTSQTRQIKGLGQREMVRFDAFHQKKMAPYIAKQVCLENGDGRC
jgi:class 3 adenylate cyclase